MEVDKNAWEWVGVDESGWELMRVDKSEWRLVAVVSSEWGGSGRERKWVGVAESRCDHGFEMSLFPT